MALPSKPPFRTPMFCIQIACLKTVQILAKEHGKELLLLLIVHFKPFHLNYPQKFIFQRFIDIILRLNCHRCVQFIYKIQNGDKQKSSGCSLTLLGRKVGRHCVHCGSSI